MLAFIFSILQGILSLVGWIKSNKDQQIGKLKQEHADDQATINVARDAARIQDQVSSKTNDQLNADLHKRMRPND